MHPPPLILRIRPSAWLAVALALVHGGALVCAGVFIAHPGVAGALAAAIAFSLVFHVRRHALLLERNAIIELTLRGGARCEVTLRNGVALAGTIEGSTFVAPWLTVVNVRTDAGQRRAIVLMPDSAPAEERRRVRVWLRHRIRSDDPASRTL